MQNRNKRSKLKLNNLRICFVRVENEIVNEQVDVSCNSSLLFIHLFYEGVGPSNRCLAQIIVADLLS